MPTRNSCIIAAMLDTVLSIEIFIVPNNSELKVQADGVEELI